MAILRFKSIKGNLGNMYCFMRLMHKWGLLNTSQKEYFLCTSTIGYWCNKGAYKGTSYEKTL